MVVFINMFLEKVPLKGANFVKLPMFQDLIYTITDITYVFCFLLNITVREIFIFLIKKAPIDLTPMRAT